MTGDAKPPFSTDGMMAGSGALSGLGAFLGASCCIIPLALAQFGVGAAFAANLGFLESAKPYFVAASAVLVLAGGFFAFRGGRRPRAYVLVLLTIAAVLTAAALVSPLYEGAVIDWLGSL